MLSSPSTQLHRGANKSAICTLHTMLTQNNFQSSPTRPLNSCARCDTPLANQRTQASSSVDDFKSGQPQRRPEIGSCYTQQQQHKDEEEDLSRSSWDRLVPVPSGRNAEIQTFEPLIEAADDCAPVRSRALQSSGLGNQKEVIQISSQQHVEAQLIHNSTTIKDQHEHSIQPLNQEIPDHNSGNENAIQLMPRAAACYFDALHIPHTHIYSRSSNPWLGVALSASPWWFMLPFNVIVYGYLGHFNLMLFSASVVCVIVSFIHITCSLQLHPTQVNKSWTAMMLYATECMFFALPCIGTLVIATTPGGAAIPGGSLLAFCALNSVYIFILNYRV